MVKNEDSEKIRDVVNYSEIKEIRKLKVGTGRRVVLTSLGVITDTGICVAGLLIYGFYSFMRSLEDALEEN